MLIHYIQIEYEELKIKISLYKNLCKDFCEGYICNHCKTIVVRDKQKFIDCVFKNQKNYKKCKCPMICAVTFNMIKEREKNKQTAYFKDKKTLDILIMLYY